MSSSTDIHAHAEEGAFEDHRAAWLGPAMGSALLTVLYTLYVVPVFFGILSTSA